MYVGYLLRGDDITKKGDWIDFFGIIVHGSAFVTFNYDNMKSLGVGSMIG